MPGPQGPGIAAFDARASGYEPLVLTLSRIPSRISQWTALDRAATTLDRVAVRSGLSDLGKRVGDLVGHTVHPALTDLPIGFWTSAWLVDMVAPDHPEVAQQLIGWGIVSALPTAAAGLADVPDLTASQRRVAALHAASNGAALALYIWSWMLRRRQRHTLGVAVSWLAAAAATSGGALGGHLVFGSSEE